MESLEGSSEKNL